MASIELELKASIRFHKIDLHFSGDASPFFKKRSETGPAGEAILAKREEKRGKEGEGRRERERERERERKREREKREREKRERERERERERPLFALIGRK